jgi:hypothetical protein
VNAVRVLGEGASMERARFDTYFVETRPLFLWNPVLLQISDPVAFAIRLLATTLFWSQSECNQSEIILPPERVYLATNRN